MTTEDLIGAYLTHLRERSCTDDTIRAYRYQLMYADKLLPYGLDCATEEEIRTWLWRGDYAPASRALFYAACVGFFRWAVEAQHLDFDPTTAIVRPKVHDPVPRVATDEQARLVLTQAKQPYRLWAQLAGYAGARCVEIYRMRREDIGPESITIHGKGNRHRAVPTHPLIWAAAAGLPSGPITDLPDAHAISNRFGQYCAIHWGIRLTLHRLRAWFATSAYMSTKDVRAVQVLLGHSSLSTTTRYIAAASPQLQAAVASLPTFTEGES